jgi:ATP-dependent helicase/DNAse subunit B
MTTPQLLLARVGAGKTETVQARVLALKRERPLAPVWVLLATTRQTLDFRRRLAQRLDRGVLFNVTLFDFYALYAELLNRAGQPVREIDGTARDHLLRWVIRDLADKGSVPTLTPIVHTAGLVRVVGDFIYELKQNRITPENFGYAVGRIAAPSTLREIAAIYAAYQDCLRENNIVDREGQGWLAYEIVKRDPRIAGDIALLAVDGFDQFSVLQADIVALLAGRAGETLITLTTTGDEMRAQTIGRRFMRARQRLDAIFQAHQIDLEPKTSDYAGGRAPSLYHLGAHLLAPRAPIFQADGALTLIEAPDPTRESAALVRRIKRLLLDGAPPDSVLVALRDYPTYAPHIGTAAARAGVPILLHYGDPIAANPAVTALMDAVSLFALDFRKRELLDVLRSPYLRIPHMEAARVTCIEQIGALVIGGRAEWRDAFDRAEARAKVDLHDPDDEDAPPAFPYPADVIVGARAALFAFFDALTPPETGTLQAYIAWLEGVIGVDAAAPDESDDAGRAASLGLPLTDDAPISNAPYTLNMPAAVRDPQAPDWMINRDLAALKALKSGLRGSLRAEALFASLDLPRERTRAAFMSELRAAADSGGAGARGSRDGRVLVTTTSDARGLPHAHVVIAGLSEGMFPAAPPEDRLLLESERSALQNAGVPIPLREERADDDGVFYELINLAAETLTLSRPYTSEGAPLPPSHLWRAVERLYTGLQPIRYEVGAPVPAAEVAAPSDALLTAISVAPSDAEADAVRAWVQTHDAPLWTHVRAAAAIETARIRSDGDPRYAVYNGVLDDPALIAHAAANVQGRVWSASQLNELGTCGYRFFAHRLLDVEQRRETTDGMDALQRGSVLHAILEAVYGAIRDQRLTITPENADIALTILDEKAPPILARAPFEYGFRASAAWAGERLVLQRQLDALIRADFDSDKSPAARALGASRRVVGVERKFEAAIPIIDDGTLTVRGVMDRIDSDGTRAFILDYKTGTTKIPLKQMVRGRNVQMAVYWLAGIALGLDVAGGAFWHIGDREFSGAMGALADEKAKAGLTSADGLAGARARMTQMVDAAARGDFAAEPNGHESGQCARYCEYAKLCRIAVRER